MLEFITIKKSASIEESIRVSEIDEWEFIPNYMVYRFDGKMRTTYPNPDEILDARRDGKSDVVEKGYTPCIILRSYSGSETFTHFVYGVSATRVYAELTKITLDPGIVSGDENVIFIPDTQ